MEWPQVPASASSPRSFHFTNTGTFAAGVLQMPLTSNWPDMSTQFGGSDVTEVMEVHASAWKAFHIPSVANWRRLQFHRGALQVLRYIALQAPQAPRVVVPFVFQPSAVKWIRFSHLPEVSRPSVVFPQIAGPSRSSRRPKCYEYIVVADLARPTQVSGLAMDSSKRASDALS